LEVFFPAITYFGAEKIKPNTTKAGTDQ